jgi:O-antigen/teichoic acid export membrane protein
MSEQLFSVILVIAGLVAAVSQIFISYSFFAAVSRYLNKEATKTNELRLTHLVGYSLAALASGGFFIAIILLVVNWTNEFPEWAGRKRLFWAGFIAALVISRLVNNSNKRGR